jgi:hypothetical protein
VGGPKCAHSTRAFLHVRSARPPGNQGAPRGDMAARSIPARRARLEGQHSQVVLAWRRRARGHEWPESSTRTRCGSSAARRPASRHGSTMAHPNAVGAKQSRVQGGRKGRRRLRWCSRWGGGVVVAGSRTAVAWRSRRSRRCTGPCSGPAPFSDVNSLLSFPRAVVEGDVLGGSTALLAA